MQVNCLNLLNWRSLKVTLIAIVFSVLFLFHTLPASAIGSSPSDPRSGEVQLDAIYEKSEDALRQEPRTLKQIQTQSSKGYNEVQGAADLNNQQMQRPENSQDTTTAADQAENALKKLIRQE